MNRLAPLRPRRPTLRVAPLAAGVALALLGLAGAGQALAHSPFGSDGAFWSGAWHLLLSPLAIAALVALGAACAGGAIERQIELAALAGLACFVASWFATPGVARFAALPVLAVGTGAVFALPPTDWPGRLLALLAGAGAGAAIDLDLRGVFPAAGAGVAALIGSVWLLEIGAHVRRRLPVALRVVGAWVAALSLLLLALQMA